MYQFSKAVPLFENGDQEERLPSDPEENTTAVMNGVI